MPRKTEDIMESAMTKTKKDIKSYSESELVNIHKSEKLQIMRDAAAKFGQHFAEEAFKDYSTSESVGYSDVSICNAVDDLFPVEFHDRTTLSPKDKKDIFQSFESGFESKKWDIEWEHKKKTGTTMFW